MSENRHFCTCPVTKCRYHPINHDKGCDPCMESNIKDGQVPNCLFQAVNPDISGVKDFSIKGFVQFYLKNNKNPLE